MIIEQTFSLKPNKHTALPGVVDEWGKVFVPTPLSCLKIGGEKQAEFGLCRIDMEFKKKKVALYLPEDTFNEVKCNYQKDGCRSQTEFMERAVLFYLDYVKCSQATDFLSPTIMSSVKAASDENIRRITRILFKLAVETALMNNLMATNLDMDEEEISSLRHTCENQVRKTNGDYNMNDALRWQKG